MNFPNFLIWQDYPSMVIHHEQYIFVIYVMAQLARERNNFQQLIEILPCDLNSLKIRSPTSR